MWNAVFVSPLQATTSKTSATQQRCLCWTHQGAGAFHIICTSKNGWTRTNRGGRTRNTSHSSWAQSPEYPGAGEEEVQTARASQPPCDHSHRKMGSSEWQGPYFCPLSQRHPWRPLPAAAEPMNLTKSDTAEVPAPPAPCHLPHPLCFRSPQLKRSWAWWKSPLSGAPASDASDTSSSKAPLIHPGGRHSRDNEGLGPFFWQRPWKVKSAFSNLTRGSAGKRNQNHGMAPPTGTQKKDL